MKVIIAEKPSVAKDIAAVLNVSGRKDGYLEGGGYQVTWAFGHLVELASPEAHGLSRPWNLENLPIIPENFQLVLKDDPGAKKQFAVLKTLFKNADEIIVATDAGREGELIFRYIYLLSGVKTPFKRLWISSLTHEAISRGLETLRPGKDYDNLFYSAQGRSQADWLVGMNATMALTVAAAGKGLLSIGRVQTPTLCLISRAYLANKNFKPEVYFNLSVILTKEGADFKAIYDLKFKSKADANKELDLVTSELECTEKEVKEVTEGAPLLFDLSSLQQESNKKHGFKAQKTLDIMQNLYEKHKVLTYPRTNSRYLSQDMRPGTLKIITDISRGTGSLAQAAKGIIKNELSAKPFNNEKITDHHAIIPTGKIPSSLDKDEGIIYSAVVVRFIQAFMSPAKKLKTTLKFKHSLGAFVANGSQLLVPGWRGLETAKDEDPEDRNDDSESEQLLPEVLQGEKLTVKKKMAEEKTTKAPSLLNEASLLRLMETAGKMIADEELKEALKDIGIGTSATRAAIIERLFKVEYIVNKGKSLLPTEKGLAVYDLVKEQEIGSPELTGIWEKKLNLIARGSYPIETFNKEIKKYTTDIVVQLKDTGKTLEIAAESNAILCPKCKKGVIKTTAKAYGCSAYQGGCDFVIWRNSFGREISQTAVDAIIKKGSSALLTFTNKEGKEYSAKLGLDDNYKLKLIFENKK